MASEARFCSACGKPVTLATEPAPVIPAEAPPPQTSDRITAPAPVASPGLAPAGASASNSIRRGLSPTQAQALQRQIAAGLLNQYRQRVMGYVGADDRQLLIALLERATKEARFCTALAYVASTRDVVGFESVLDHPERALPLGIEMWAERQSADARARSASPARAQPGASGHTRDYVLCPKGHRVPWYAPACPTCGATVGATAPPAPPGALGTFPADHRGQQLPYAAPRTNGLAIASLVLGILWLWWTGSLLALILGYASLRQIRQRGDAGRGIAIAGIVLGWVGVGLGVILAILIVLAAISAPPGYGY